MDTNNQPAEKRSAFTEREIERMFEGIRDEIAILIATAKFNYTTCKIDQNTLALTLAYVDDTEKLVNLLKNRINLLIDTTRPRTRN